MGERLGAGDRVGSWIVEAELGRGGMGVVYRARHAEDGRAAAVKVVGSWHRQDPRYLERFRREVELGRALAHANVVRVLDAGTSEGDPFVAFELIEGGSLEQALARRGPFPPTEAVALAVGIARALVAIHAAGLVHRDLKPANVLRGADGEVKVGDFGLVRPPLDAATLTRTGELLGTLDYMAPEQADRAQSVDGRADLYALGATLFALLTAKPPFEGHGIELITKHLTAAPPAPGSHVPGIPAALDELVLALLAKEPDKRPASAEAVLGRLLEIGKAPPRAPRSAIRVVAPALVAAAVVAWWVTRSPPTTQSLPVAPAPARAAPPAPVVTTPRVVTGLNHVDSTPLDCFGTAIDCSPREGGVVAIAAEKNGVFVLDARGSVRWRAPTIGDAKAVAFTEDGNLLAVGTTGAGGEASLQVFEAATGKRFPPELRGHGDRDSPPKLEDKGPKREPWVSVVLSLPDGRLASGGYDGTIRLWKPGTNEPPVLLGLSETGIAHEGEVATLAVSGTTLVSGGDGGRVRAWDLRTTRLEGEWGGGLEGVYLTKRAVAISPGGVILFGDNDGGVFEWRPGSAAKRLWTAPRGRGEPRVTGVAFVGGDRFGVSVGWDGGVRLFDLQKGRDIATTSLGTECRALAVDREQRIVYVSTSAHRLERFEVVRSR
jgi:hypothetical protein